VLGAAAICVNDWFTARDMFFAHGGWFPLTDGASWWDCGKALERAAPGFQATAWCQWRPAYPAMLASLSVLVGDDTRALLLVQAGLVGLAVFLLVREIARLTGLIGAGVAACLIFAFADIHAIGQIETENPGLIFGMIGLALLLRGAARVGPPALVLGTAGLSLALAARPGAMLALPLLVLWMVFTLWRRERQPWRIVALVCLAAVVGPALHSILVAAEGGVFANSGGNFSYTLYGMVTGGRGWQAVLTDHPELASLETGALTAAIYRLAWAAFLLHPADLAHGLSVGFWAWAVGLYETAPAWALPALRWALMPAGIASLCIGWRQPERQMLAVLFLGEAVSAPLLGGDGGPRVFAATMPVDIVIATLGLQVLIRLGSALVRRGSLKLESEEPPLGLPILPVALLVGMTALCLAPLLPLRLLSAPEAAAPLSCGPGLKAYRFAIDDGFVLQKTASGGRVEPLVAAPADRMLAQERLAKAWWASVYHDDRPVGSALMLFSAAGQNGQQTGLARLVWPDAPDMHRGDRVELCVDERLSTWTLVTKTVVTVVSGRVL
jgi:hypothetical protein